MFGEGQRLMTPNGSLIPIMLVVPLRPVLRKYRKTKLPSSGKFKDSGKVT